MTDAERLQTLIQALEDMDSKMVGLTVEGDEEEWITMYNVPAGPWHRILGLIRGGLK